MTDDDKKPFLMLLVEIGKVYDQPKAAIIEKSPIYWAALNHRSLDDVRAALNAHVRDSDRGRFFPKPADVEAKLPGLDALWLSPGEAWAMCPKNESDSAAMTQEMTQALVVAQELIEDGDMIAARMAFKGAYSRLVDEAKRDGRMPQWFASLGSDSHGRHIAKVKVVEMQNLALPHDQKKSLPAPEQEYTVRLEDLSKKAQEKTSSPEEAKRHFAELKRILANRKGGE